MGAKTRFTCFENKLLERIVMYKLLLILSLSALACGVSTSLPDAIPTPSAVYLSPTPEAQYIVTAETLQIRDGAGEEFAPLGYLERGEIVTCYSIDPAEDGGRWCRHDNGWSNTRYMKGLK